PTPRSTSSGRPTTSPGPRSPRSSSGRWSRPTAPPSSAEQRAHRAGEARRILDHRVVPDPLEGGPPRVGARLEQAVAHGVHGDRVLVAPDDAERRGMGLDRARVAPLLGPAVVEVADGAG